MKKKTPWSLPSVNELEEKDPGPTGGKINVPPYGSEKLDVKYGSSLMDLISVSSAVFQVDMMLAMLESFMLLCLCLALVLFVLWELGHGGCHWK